jgi:hypothetical protein
VMHSAESLTASQDQPVNGRLAWAGGSPLLLAHGSRSPPTLDRVTFRVLAFPDLTRDTGWDIWSRRRVTGPYPFFLAGLFNWNLALQ